MKRLVIMILLGALTQCAGCALFRDRHLDHIYSPTSMRERGMRLPAGVQQAVCTGNWVRIVDVIEMRYFNDRAYEYLYLYLWIEQRRHWESAWTGTMLLRKPTAAADWSGAAQCPESIAFDELLDLSYRQREKLFKTTRPVDIEQSPGRDSERPEDGPSKTRQE